MALESGPITHLSERQELRLWSCDFHLPLMVSGSYPPASGSQEARGVTFVDKHHGSVLLSQVADPLQRRHISVHGEDSVCDYEAHTSWLRWTKHMISTWSNPVSSVMWTQIDMRQRANWEISGVAFVASHVTRKRNQYQRVGPPRITK